MDNQIYASDSSAISGIEINKVLKNTYLLLGASFAFSALMAFVAMALQVPPISPFIYLAVVIGLPFIMAKTANKGIGILMVFLFTGFFGFYAGPILAIYQSAFGGQIIVQAMGLTALVFFGLSGYVLTTRKDFSFMRGFLFTGVMVAFGVSVLYMLANWIFGVYISGLSLALSAAFVLLMSGYILYDTSDIIHGRQTNYVIAAMNIFINLYVLFMNLLHLLSVLTGED